MHVCGMSELMGEDGAVAHGLSVQETGLLCRW